MNEKKILRVSDKKCFRTIFDVMHECFGDTKEKGAYRDGFYDLNGLKDKCVAWFSKMAYKDGDKWVKTDETYENILQDDSTITEKCENSTGKDIEEKFKKLRFVFGKFDKRHNREEGYYFLGLFLLSTDSVDGNAVHYRVSDSADLSEWVK